MAHSIHGKMCGCAGKTVRPLDSTYTIPEHFCDEVASKISPRDGLYTAQNNEAKWHSSIHCHSVNKHCFVMCAWKIRQKMQIAALLVTNLVQFNLMNEFQLIYKN